MAHLHILADAYRRYDAAGGLGELPPGCKEWGAELAAEADHRLAAAVDFIQEHVNFQLVRRPDQKGHKCLGGIRQSDLIKRLKDSAQGHLLMHSSSKVIKAIVNKAMLTCGRALLAEFDVGGVTYKIAYKDCALMERESADPLGG